MLAERKDHHRQHLLRVQKVNHLLPKLWIVPTGRARRPPAATVGAAAAAAAAGVGLAAAILVAAPTAAPVGDMGARINIADKQRSRSQALF